MKKYVVNVNGTKYEITVESIDGAAAATAPAAAPAQVAAPAPAQATPAGGEKVTAPMPGTILDVKVANGETVKKGQLLVILEAIKMENEIMAPCDGVVSSVVAKGSSVETGALICAIQ